MHSLLKLPSDKFTERTAMAIIVSAHDPSSVEEVRDAAIRMTGGATDKEVSCQRIFRVMRDGILYVRDPVHIEKISDPLYILRGLGTHAAAEDCDGHASVAMALCNSIGIRTRLCLTAKRRRKSGKPAWEHVHCEAMTRKGWRPMDSALARRPWMIAYADRVDGIRGYVYPESLGESALIGISGLAGGLAGPVPDIVGDLVSSVGGAVSMVTMMSAGKKFGRAKAQAVARIGKAKSRMLEAQEALASRYGHLESTRDSITSSEDQILLEEDRVEAENDLAIVTHRNERERRLKLKKQLGTASKVILTLGLVTAVLGKMTKK
jgi:hypothetical protein